MYDVVIIGAGIVGAMTARVLAAYDLKICILEKENDVAMGATKANSAIVHAGFDAAEGSLKAKFNVLGSKMMPEITSELGVKYINNGSLVLGFSDEDKCVLNELKSRGESNGVEGLRIVDAQELRSIEPNISPTATAALIAPTGAIVCPYELCIAAIGNAIDNGAELKRNFEVAQIGYTDDIYEIKSVSGDIVNARFVVNAAGLYSDTIASMIGDTSVCVHPRKGEYILLDKECGSVVSHTIFRVPDKMGKGILISPTVDGNLITGPTSVDVSDKENNDTSLSGFDKIIKETSDNVCGVNFGKSITSFCGLRAVGNTGDFIINSPRRGFVNLCGIESPGLSASPAIALHVKNMLNEAGLELKENKSYNPYRKPAHFFREASIDEKNEIIKHDSRYGRIVCRCEQVTEGEIVYAINQNPKPLDMDGIKRRTRAQMGRCQGGFCSTYIMEILSKEMDIPMLGITKHGGDSRFILSKTKGGNAQ